MSHPPVLIVPGKGNSEAAHWQSILEASTAGASRVEQCWNVNDISVWAENIDQAVAHLDSPPLVVAHSFGCLAAAYAELVLGTPIGAKLFVAPADPVRFGIDRALLAQPLLGPGIVVASTNDPWLAFDAALGLARDWGVELINLGNAGHINVASGYGYWPFGEALMETLRADLESVQSVRMSRDVHPFPTNFAV